MKKEKWIVYDGINDDVEYVDSKKEAIEMLEEIKASGKDYDREIVEWIDGIEHCFIAKITHTMKETEYNGFIDYEIKKERKLQE